ERKRARAGAGGGRAGPAAREGGGGGGWGAARAGGPAEAAGVGSDDGARGADGLVASPAGALAIVMLPADRISKNDYNPNEMSEKDQEAYAAEVRRLKRLPRALVVRPSHGGH